MNKNTNYPTALIIFGVSGDLFRKKLIISIYFLYYKKMLPDNFYLFGFSSSIQSKKIFHENIVNDLKEKLQNKFNEHKQSVLNFLKIIYCQNSKYTDINGFNNLHISIKKNINIQNLQLLFYFSTPSNLVNIIIHNIVNSTLYLNTKWIKKILIEKPFGEDYNSCIKLKNIISKYFLEKNVFYIDHYLAKKAIQNILYLRYYNHIIESLFSNQHIDYIEITLSETIGIEQRAKYYDKSGALKDMFQNHILQIISLLSMNIPKNINIDNIITEKVNILKKIQTIKSCNIIRGQYVASLLNNSNLPSYINEAGVYKNSKTETYIALKLYINNKKWNGIPFYIRSGKRLKKNIVSILINFKKNNNFITNNKLLIQIKPKNSIVFYLNEMNYNKNYNNDFLHLKNVINIPLLKEYSFPNLNMHQHPHSQENESDYENIILNAINGNKYIFSTIEEIQESWRIIDDIIKNPQVLNKIYYYKIGSWGPICSNSLLNNGHIWSNNEI